MNKHVEVEYLDIEENKEWEAQIERVINECFVVEKMEKSKIYISITLTTPEHIREFNKEYRNIDKETDVLSFPIFEKDEIDGIREDFHVDVLGDIIISIDRVKEQAEEEDNADDNVTKFELFGSDSKSLYELDAEMKARVYTAPSFTLD